MEQRTEVRKLLALLGDRLPPLYAALPSPTSIRVLDISTNLGPDCLIKCQLKVVDLDDEPDYCALSYTWGDPGPTLPNDQKSTTAKQADKRTPEILCNGHVIEVTKNAHDFLATLRKVKIVHMEADRTQLEMLEGHHIGYVWMDAVCINQMDLAERSAQVQMMDRIYKQARKVVIWLGPSDSTTKVALNTLCSLSSVSLESCAEVYGKSRSNPDAYEKLGIPMINNEEWLAVWALYMRSWFTRAWTVQECVLAREVDALCGSVMIPFAGIIKAARVMALIGWDLDVAVLPGLETHPLPTVIRGEQGISQTSEASQSKLRLATSLPFTYPSLYLAYLQEIQDHPWGRTSDKERWQEGGNTFPFQAVLKTTAHTACSNAADRIYAFLGLVPSAAVRGIPLITPYPWKSYLLGPHGQ